MEPVIIIETHGELEAMIKGLASARHIAIDTESNSFYAYFERLCLIQISTGETDYIVDPLTMKDMSPLGEILMDPGIEKIFHAASNDIMGLKRDYQFTVRSLFDTATACKLLGYKQLGLAKILGMHFGVVLNKKWQRHDWGRRPLGKEHLDYARLDTHYLIALRHRLAEELRAKELWEQAVAMFDKECEQELQVKPFRPEGFIHIQGARTLDAAGKRVLQALYQYREHEARRRNRAPFRVLSNEALLRLAHQRPRDVHDFSKIKGLPRSYHNGSAANSLLELIIKNEDIAEENGIRGC